MPVGDPSQTETGPAPIARSGKHYATHPFAAGGVTAFASDLVNANLVSFDATSPSTLTLDVPANGNSFLAGDFKGEDFSTLYAIDFLSFDLYKVDTATGALTLVYLAVPPPGAQSGLVERHGVGSHDEHDVRGHARRTADRLIAREDQPRHGATPSTSARLRASAIRPTAPRSSTSRSTRTDACTASRS